MDISKVTSAPWAITPAAFQSVCGVVDRHLRGESADIAALEAKLGRPLDNQRSGVQIDRGVAVIAIEGILAKRMNLLTQVSAGTSTQIISGQFAQALADPGVSAIVLAIDSPGGTVDGTQALADQIYAARGQKPIYAVAEGCMCSAAYWIGSAADKVFIADETTRIGSIGVLAQHTDQSGSDAARGLKVTSIAAGKFKDAASPHQPLSASGRDIIQAQVDSVYTAFLNDVARNRGASPGTVHEVMADGRVFIGRQAVSAGLADDVKTAAAVIAHASRASPITHPAASVAATPGDISLAALRLIDAEAAKGRTLAFRDALTEVTGDSQRVL